MTVRLRRRISQRYGAGSVNSSAVAGIRWAFLVFCADKVVTLGMMMVLARLFSPGDFGIIAAALLVITLVDAFRDIGLRDALIWDSRGFGTLASTAFWAHLLLGFVLLFALIVAAPFLASRFSAPELEPLLRVLAFSLFVTSLGTTHEALQDKALHFGVRYAVDLAATLAKAFAALSLALAGYGILSVAIGILVAALVRTGGRWLTLAWLPAFGFSLAELVELLRFARHIVTTRVADLMIERADQFVILLLLKNTQIGLYYIAARIPELLLTSINVVATRVLFPAYVEAREEPGALKAMFLSTTRFMGYVFFPAGFGLALVADLAIVVLFGEQWRDAAPSLAILAICSAAFSVLWSGGDVMKALGKPEYLARITLFQLATAVPLIFVLVDTFQAIEAAAIGLLISLLIDIVVKLIVIRRLVDVGAAEFLSVLKGAAVATLAMGLAVAGLRTIAAFADAIVLLPACVVTGGLVYFAALWHLERQHLISALAAIRRPLRGAG